MISGKPGLLLLITCFVLICGSYGALIAQEDQPPVDPPADGESDTMAHLAELKLRQEVLKLRSENEEKTDWDKLLTLVTGIVGVLITLIVAAAGFSLNLVQKDKLKQDLTINKRKHWLEIFEILGSTQPRVRMGAVAVLTRWLREEGVELVGKEDLSVAGGTVPWTARISDDKLHEIRWRRRTIASVLVSVTKFEETEEIQKYIADNLAGALEAIVEPGKTQNDLPKTSPLKDDSFDFQGARLTNAWWKRIDARGVDFYAATLDRASLRQGFLNNAIFSQAKLERAVFEDAILTGAYFIEANLRNARMARADLVNTKLEGADLTRVDLRDARLIGAQLPEASLRWADLSGAILTKADFTNALLSNANFAGATLDDTSFDGADLRGVDLTAANIRGRVSRENVTTDANTVLPD